MRPRANYDVYLKQTPGQTLGPFFQQGLLRTRAAFQVPGVCSDESDVFNGVLARTGAAGDRIVVEGVVYDGLDQPITDALVEIWQANAHGHYHHPLDASGKDVDPAFTGFGRVATNAGGAFSFTTVKPGPIAGSGGTIQASHINLVLGARGMPRHAFTRIYFAADSWLGRDPVLSLVPEARRESLIAHATGTRDGTTVYRFDVHLQGERETVFFEL